VKTAGPGLARQGVGYALRGLYGGSAPTPVSAIQDAPTPVSAFPDALGVTEVNGAPVAPSAGRGRVEPASRGVRGRGRGKCGHDSNGSGREDLGLPVLLRGCEFTCVYQRTRRITAWSVGTQ
jgi:hypothetical protein